MYKPGTYLNTLLAELRSADSTFGFHPGAFVFGSLEFTEYLAELSATPYPTRG